MPVRLGYACINAELRKDRIFCSRTMRLATLKEKGPEAIQSLANENIKDLKKILIKNDELGIHFFRITSNLFPHMENPKVEKINRYGMAFAKKMLEDIGEFAREYNHRLTFHPGQYTHISAKDPKIVKQAIIDLSLHARVFQYMELEPEDGSVMVIHGGGVYDDRPKTLKRLIKNFKTIPESTAKYVVFENDEMYSIMDLLPVCEKLNVPLCVDYFHHTLYGAESFDAYDEKLTKRIIQTWRRRNIKPKFHWSEQEPDARRGAHSTVINYIPCQLLTICKRYNCDIMLESKGKEKNVKAMHAKYFTPNYGDDGRLFYSIH